MSDEQAKQIEKWVGQYIVLRDWIKREDEKHKAHVTQAKKDMDTIAGRLQAFLDATGQIRGSAKTGTFYTTIKRSASITDKTEFQRHVIGAEAWDLLDWRANVNAVEDFIKENEISPPGVKVTQVAKIGVRRPGAADGED